MSLLVEIRSLQYFILSKVKPVKLPSICRILSLPDPKPAQRPTLLFSYLISLQTSLLMLLEEMKHPQDLTSSVFDMSKINEIIGAIEWSNFKLVHQATTSNNPNTKPSRFVPTVKHCDKEPEVFRQRFEIGGYSDHVIGNNVHSAKLKKRSFLCLKAALAASLGF